MGVSMYPGTMAFDRMAKSFSEAAASTATERVKPSTPALDAAYGTAPVPAFNASNEETLIIHFERGVAPVASFLRVRTRLRIAARIRAREVSTAPSRFVRRIWEMSASSDLGRILEMEIPAALTRISTVACTVVSKLCVTELRQWYRAKGGVYHFLLQLTHPRGCFSDITNKETNPTRCILSNIEISCSDGSTGGDTRRGIEIIGRIL